ncbi:alkaline phosphatase D family protein [Pontibacter burrus]|uniref:Alkaline phosphatase family protein n=1 Tax=Pontibacter burrus TaxID=2704466 RepID=A0A6B3LL84_9BACT|nr:alkaline phosphatase D family protein [Pontibacter burrus]NEM97692.1 alkaline phosphatase family protein [Pontibacter burrus]
MGFYRFLFCCILCLGCTTIAWPQHATNTITIAFGSCNDQFKAQPLWDDVIAAKPDLWVWLGDNIYADTDDMQQMQRYYRHQLQHPGYKQLLQTCPVTGTWDDHDYAGDNADKHFPHKKVSQQLFLDFMHVPDDAPVRSQEGIYRSFDLEKAGRKVKILLLDDVYHRDPLRDVLGLYLPNNKGDVLGEAQWQWLERELTNSDADIHIIASGLQVLPTSSSFTNWSAFPVARRRLLNLIHQTDPAVPIIISGDRHVGELSKMEFPDRPYPLYEITSSGMTHYREAKRAGNRHRIGEQVGALNFGVLQISWTNNSPTITMQVRGDNGKLYLQQTHHYYSDSTTQR